MTPLALRKYQRYLLYTLVALLPLIITPTGKDIFRLGKEVFAQILALGIVCLAAAELIQERAAPGLPKILLLPVASFCLWGAAALLWTRVPALASYALFNLVLFSTFTFALARLLEPPNIRFVILLNLLPASLTALYIVIQYFGVDPLLVTPQGTPLSGRENAGGLVGDVNTAGCYLAGSLMLAVNSAFLEKSILRRGLALTGCAAVLIGLLFTQTLTAIGATLAASAVLVVLNSYTFLFYSREKRRLWFTLLCLVLLGAVAGGTFVLRNEKFRQRLSDRYHDLLSGNWSRLTSYRAPVFAVTWQMALERPLTGHGLHSFGTDFYAAKLRHRPGQLIIMPGSIESTPRQTHNEYLQVWAELGLVGLALLLVIMGGLLHSAFSVLAATHDLEARCLIVSLLCSFVTMSVAGFGFFPAHLALTAVWAIIPSAAILSLAQETRIAGPKAEARQTPTLRPRSPSHASLNLKPSRSLVPSWTPAVAALSVTLGGGYLLLSPLVANERISEATTLIERVMRGQEPSTQVYLERSLSLLKDARRENPLEPQIYQSAGTAHWFLYQFDQALENFSRAALLDPTPEAFTNLGEAYRGLGQLEIAEKSFETALAYNPDFEKAKHAKSLIEEMKAPRSPK